MEIGIAQLHKKIEPAMHRHVAAFPSTMIEIHVATFVISRVLVLSLASYGSPEYQVHLRAGPGMGIQGAPSGHNLWIEAWLSEILYVCNMYRFPIE